jgi:16S rRNA (cytosine1402-N4)-methyltransferase
MADGPLDMRMSDCASLSAADVIRRYPEDELVRIFSEYGEERFSRRIARKITEVRKTKRIEKTGDLVDVIKSIVPFTHSRIHPATRVFQALRIEVNKELDSLGLFLKEADKYLNTNGRLAIISFHSLEDRLVKRAFIDKKINNLFRIITKKPIIPTVQEIERNLRSRSAKLRVAEKI